MDEHEHDPIPDGKDTADVIGRKTADPTPEPVAEDHDDYVAAAEDAVLVPGTEEAE